MAHVPTFVGKGAFQSGTGALTVPVPTGYRNDDVLLLFVESANQAITAPAGWVETGAQASQGTGTAAAAGGVRLAVFWKIASGSEASVAVADSGDHTTAIMMAFRGLDPANPIDTFSSKVDSTATTAMSWNSVTTTQPNDLIVLAAAMDIDAASTTTLGTVTNANLTSITEQHDQTVIAGAGGGLAIVTAIKATAGATGASTATGSTSTTHGYLTLALRTRADATTAPRGQYLNDQAMLTPVSTGGTVAPATDGIMLMSDVSPMNSLDEIMLYNVEAKTTATTFNNTASVTAPAFEPEASDLTYGSRGGSLVYDVKNDRYIAIFGYDGTTRYNHVWEKKMDRPGQPWRRITPSGTAPTGRNLAGTTYVRGTTSGSVDKAYAITFGGFTSADNNDMYALDLTTPGSEAWTTITQTGTPAARSYITRHMVSTPVSGQPSQNYVYLFGGYAGASRVNDLQRFTFNVNTPTAVTWTTLKANGAAGNPGVREGAIFDYKASTNKMYLYGGYSGSAVYNDFWEYDVAGNTWTQITPAGTAPTGTSLGTGGYDPVNNRFWFAAGWQNTQATTRNNVGFVAGVGDSSATNTYYFNGTVTDSNNVWANDANLTDGDSATMATSGGLYNSTQTENYIKVDGTNAPTSSNPISQVRARMSGFTSQPLTPMYADIYSGTELLGTASLSGTSNAYGTYANLSTPTGGWSYAKLQSLSTVIYGGNFDGSYGVSQVEVEVTQGPLWVEVRPHNADNQAFASSANIASAVDTKRNWIIVKGEMTFDSTERYSYIIDMNEAYTGTAPQPVYGMNEGDWMGARDAPASVWNPDRNEWLIINGFAQMYDEQTIVSGTHVSEVWAYNPTTNTWRYATKGHKTMPMTEGTVGVYDTKRQRVLLFGGLSGASETHNEVWSLTADQYGMYEYKKLSPTGTPPTSRWLCAGVYDPSKDRFIIAMGGNDTGPLSTTTLYGLTFANGADGAWTQWTPSGTATAVKGPGFADVPSLKRLYIFGGATNAALSTVSSQLVYLDYSGFTPAWVTPTSSAGTARRTPAFGVDLVNGKLVAFGGFSGSASLQTLQYWDIASGGAWTTAQPTLQPDARRSPGAFFINSKFYMTHGRTDSSKWYANTWELTPNYPTPASSTWSNKTPRKYQPNYAYFDPDTAANYHWQAWVNEDGTDQPKMGYGATGDVISTATYYFDASDAAVGDPGGVWGSDANAADGDTSTSANTSTSGSSSSNYLLIEGTNAPSSGLEIRSVKVRVFTNTTDQISYAVYSDNAGDFLIPASIPTWTSSYSGWSPYTTLAAPTGGWSWTKLQALEFRVWRSTAILNNGSNICRAEILVEMGNDDSTRITNHYFDAHSGVADPGAAWTTGSNAFDGKTSTIATTSVVSSATSNYLGGTGTNAPASGASTITQVRARRHGGGTGNGTATEIRYAGVALGVVAAPGPPGSSWSPYTTLTAPSGGWTWAKVAELEARSYATNGSGSFSELEVEVTSTLATADTDFVLGSVTPSFTKSHGTSAVKKTQGTRSHTTDADMRTTIHFTKDSNPTLPTTADPVGTAFSKAEVVNATTDNGVYTDVTGNQYLLNVYERWHTNSTDQISATWNGKSSLAASTTPVYLKIWNNNTASWEIIASNTTAAADTEFTLSGGKTTNLANYYQSGNKVVFMVQQ